MSAKPDEATIRAAADKASSEAIVEFSMMHPDAKMSYVQWLDLGMVIEDEIKKAFGIEDRPEESVNQIAPTVQ